MANFNFLYIFLLVFTQTKKCVEKDGWKCVENPPQAFQRDGEKEFCDIDVINGLELSSEEFEKIYRNKKPVLLNFDELDDWTYSSMWTRKNLKEKYGRSKVSVAKSLSVVRTGGMGLFQEPLGLFLSKKMYEKNGEFLEPWYVFTRKYFDKVDFFKKFNAFEKDKRSEQDSIFMVGSTHSGTAFHKHADAWNGVLHGSKRWFLYPPEICPAGGVWPGYSMIHWFQKIYPTLEGKRKPIECLQTENTILYVPESWYHGTVNIHDTVAISLQKKEAVTERERLTYQKIHSQLSEKETFEVNKKLLALLPENAQAWHDYGWSLTKNGKLKKGVKALKKSTVLEPDFVSSYVALAQVFQRNRKFKKALKWIKIAFEKNSFSEFVVRNYAEILNANDMQEEALENWYLFLTLTDNNRSIDQAKMIITHLESQLGSKSNSKGWEHYDEL